MSTVLILGCSRRKRPASDGKLPAIEMYEGGGIPEIRECIGSNAHALDRTFILSAKYGLLSAREPIDAYDEKLTLESATQMRPVVREDFLRRVTIPFFPTRILLLLEPIYFSLLSSILDNDLPPRIIWEPDISSGIPFMIKEIMLWKQRYE